MTFQSAPNAAEIRVLFDVNDGEKRVGFSLYSRRASANWTVTELTAVAASVYSAVEDDFIPVLSAQHSFVGVIAKDLENEFPVFVEQFAPAPIPGDVAGDALPSQNAVVVTWLGATGSAPRRGRIYLPSPAESQVEGSRLTSAAQTALDAAAVALRASVEDPAGVADASQAIVSRYSGSTVVGTSLSGKAIKEANKRAVAVVNGVSGYRLTNRIDSQRKRMPREAA